MILIVKILGTRGDNVLRSGDLTKISKFRLGLFVDSDISLRFENKISQPHYNRCTNTSVVVNFTTNNPNNNVKTNYKSTNYQNFYRKLKTQQQPMHRYVAQNRMACR